MPFHPQIFYHHEDISEIKEDHTMKAYKKQISSRKKKRRLQKVDEGGTEFREELCVQFPGSVVRVEVCQ